MVISACLSRWRSGVQSLLGATEKKNRALECLCFLHMVYSGILTHLCRRDILSWYYDNSAICIICGSLHISPSHLCSIFSIETDTLSRSVEHISIIIWIYQWFDIHSQRNLRKYKKNYCLPCTYQCMCLPFQEVIIGVRRAFSCLSLIGWCVC